MNPSRRTFLITGFIAIAAVNALAATETKPRGKPAIYTGEVAGVAVGGYDPVAYFSGGEPVKGREDITLEHDGVIWRFASENNREAFKAEPARYAPKYGGYCAYAVSGGGSSPGDPRHWKIVDGKLYLNASRRVHERWEKDIPGHIRKADANWPGVLVK
jgi:YHS domain-containing protein